MNRVMSGLFKLPNSSLVLVAFGRAVKNKFSISRFGTDEKKMYCVFSQRRLYSTGPKDDENVTKLPVETGPKDDDSKNNGVPNAQTAIEFKRARQQKEYREQNLFFYGKFENLSRDDLLVYIGKLESDLENARYDAAVYEFLLISRKKLELLRKYFGKNCPEEKKFVSEIKARVPAFQSLSEDTIISNDEMLMGGKYFRSILWILATTPRHQSEEIENLRNKLEKDPIKYIWFARQGQNLYGLYSDDLHDESKIAGSKYVDMKFIQLYVKNLPIDFKKAVLLLWSENLNQ